MQHLSILYRSNPEDHLIGTVHPETLKELFGSSIFTSQHQHPLILKINSNNNSSSSSSSSFFYISVLPPNTTQQNVPKRCLVVDPIVAQTTLGGLREKDEILATAACAPPQIPPVASRTFVEPASIDDSEIAEENATLIEMMMLQIVNVVFVGQRIPVTLKSAGGMRVTLKVTSILPANLDENESNDNDNAFSMDRFSGTKKEGFFGVMMPGSELVIATKKRSSKNNNATDSETEGATSDNSNARKRTAGVLRMIPNTNTKEQSEENVSQAKTAGSPLSALTISATTSQKYGWKNGQEICILDLAFWADALLEDEGSQHHRLRQQNNNNKNNRPNTPAPPSRREILSDPTLLRKSARVQITVVSSSSSSSSSKHDDFCLGCPSSELSTLIFNSPIVKRANVSTCFFCWIPETSSPSSATTSVRSLREILNSFEKKKKLPHLVAASSSSSSLFPIRYSSSDPPSMEQLKQVHDEQNINYVSHLLSFDNNNNSKSSEPASSSFVPSKIMISSNRGCSKSSIALRCALDSNRHVIVVECASLRQDFTKQLPVILMEAILCGPSCIILEDIENIVARERDLAGGPASVSAPQATQHALSAVEGLLFSISSTSSSLDSHCLWYSSNKEYYFCDVGDGDSSSSKVVMKNNAISIIATTPDTEMIHPRISRHGSGPFGFSYHYRVNLPGLTSRTNLIEQMMNNSGSNHVIRKTPPSSVDKKKLISELATETEHFSPGDLALLFKQTAKTQMMADDRNDSNNNNNNSRSSSFLRTAIDLVINKKIIPLALSSVNFLNSSNKGGSKKSQDGNESSLSWGAVGGLIKARQTLNECIVLPCRYPQIFDKLPLKSRSGVLLYGPSGCGKSYIVACLAAAENLNCIVVNGPEILDKYIGQSEAKVREVFERAQSAAPCVLFLDEFDSIAPQRGNDNTGVTDRVVNQLLTYLDGVESRSKVYVVAASSRPDLIDVALLRPGRLDRHVLCGFPTKEERREILLAHIRNGLPNAEKVIQNVGGEEKLFEISDNDCDNWTCADVAALVTSAGVAFSKRMTLKAERDFEERKNRQAEKSKDQEGQDNSSSSNQQIFDKIEENATNNRVTASCSSDKHSFTISSTSAERAEQLAKKYELVGGGDDERSQVDSLMDFLDSKMKSPARQKRKDKNEAASSSSSMQQKQSSSVIKDSSSDKNNKRNEELMIFDDFAEAIRNTRPSCSEKEFMRLNMLYDQFQNRGKKTAIDQTSSLNINKKNNKNIDRRVTMA